VNNKEVSPGDKDDNTKKYDEENEDNDGFKLVTHQGKRKVKES